MAASPLQKGPSGLLEAFDLKTLGQPPTLFGDTVTPVSDVTDNYTRPNWRVFTTTQAVAANGFFALVNAAPILGLWRVRSLELAATVAAAEYESMLELRIAFSLHQGIPWTVATREHQPAPAGHGLSVATLHLAWQPPQPMLLTPSDQIFASVANMTTANAWSGTLNVMVEFFPV